MYCRPCGKEVRQQAVVCVSCGCAPLAGNKFCPSCGAETPPSAVVCTKCGAGLSQATAAASGQPKPPGLAIASLVCGIAGFPMIFACWSGIAVGTVGAVLGHIALKKIRESQGTLGGEGMAKAGMICGYISAALGVLLLIAYIIFIVFAVSRGEMHSYSE